MEPITETQAKVLDSIISHLREEVFIPTYEQIALSAGLNNPGSVSKAIKGLCSKGYLQRVKGKRRGVELLPSAKLFYDKPYKVASLFAGCGGLDLGFLGGFEFSNRYFRQTQFQIVWANDFDRDAQRTYSVNKKYFCDHPIDPRDIWEVDPNEIPLCDIVLAGFPCQPFSNAGNRKGVHDPRGTLFYACANIVRNMLERSEGGSPKAFIFENVRGITSSKMPDGTPVPEEIKKRMLRLGFNTQYKLVKASNYGVPQQRYRVIFVGTRIPSNEFDFSLFDKVSLANSLPSEEKKDEHVLSLGYALKDIPQNAPNFDDVWHLSESAMYMVEKIGKCEGSFDEFYNWKKSPGNDDEDYKKFKIGRSWKNMNPGDMSPRFRKIWDNPQVYRAPNFYRKFALGEICGTITASAQPENCGIVHPLEDRRYSVREIARLQSFPDDFVFEAGSLAGMYKVIGNAVPPLLGWVIAQALQKHIIRNQSKYEIPISEPKLNSIISDQQFKSPV